MTIMAALVKPKFAAVAERAGCRADPRIRPGRTVGAFRDVAADVKIVAVRQHVNAPPVAETRLQEGDGLLLVGSPTSIEQAKASMGREEPGRLSRDRATSMSCALRLEGGLRRQAASGHRPARLPVVISHVRRAISN